LIKNLNLTRWLPEIQKTIKNPILSQKINFRHQKILPSLPRFTANSKLSYQHQEAHLAVGNRRMSTIHWSILEQYLKPNLVQNAPGGTMSEFTRTNGSAMKLITIVEIRNQDQKDRGATQTTKIYDTKNAQFQCVLRALRA